MTASCLPTAGSVPAAQRNSRLRNIPWLAVQMLHGDKRKYLAMILSVSLSALLIAEQLAIFCGLMLRTVGQIRDVHGVDIWVMDPHVQFIDDIRQMPGTTVDRIRGIPGVDWAVPFHKNLTRVRLRNGTYQIALVFGVDDESLVGAPTSFVIGGRESLHQPERVLVDDAGFRQLWPDSEFQLDGELEINEHRATVGGICKVSRTFNTFPIIYSRFRDAARYSPIERHFVSFVLVRTDRDFDANQVCELIQARTGLQALTTDGFAIKTMTYFLGHTGIAVNFAITVLLGLVVGAAITGQTFRIFTFDHLHLFAILKAIGTRSSMLVLIVMIQAFLIGFIGLGMGLGFAAICGEGMRGGTKLAFYMPWQVAALTAGAVAIMLAIASAGSVRHVTRVDPILAFGR